MDNKRYQVFVSSTYTDLTAARQAVLMTLLTMDCLPAGMELFGAVDEEQFEFIKRVIDDSDYYVLIIGGRYGTEAPDGKSYTEKEYDYAVLTGKKVLAFLHAAPETLPAKDYEGTPEGRKKLDLFKDKVNSGRLRTTWQSVDDLAGKVAVSLQRTIKLSPAVGWVRADTIANVQALSELNELRKEVERLRQQEGKPVIENLAALDDAVEVSGSAQGSRGHAYSWNAEVTWRGLFAVLLPQLIGGMDEHTIISRLSDYCHERSVDDNDTHTPRLSDGSLQRVKVQLLAFKAIEVRHDDAEYGPPTAWWRLTDAGQKLMLDAGAVRSQSRDTFEKRRSS